MSVRDRGGAGDAPSRRGRKEWSSRRFSFAFFDFAERKARRAIADIRPLSPKNARRPTCRSAVVPRRDRGEDARAPTRGVTIVPDTPRAAKSREEDRAPYLLLVRARLAVLRRAARLADARLLRLPHGRQAERPWSRRGRVRLASRSTGPHATATVRRSGRLVNAELSRRAPAVTPGRLIDRRSAVDWRGARSVPWRVRDGSEEKRRMSAAETPFLGRQKKVPQCTSARSSVMSDRARLESVARRAHDAAIARHLHIRVRAVGPRGASPARPPRASAGFPRSRSALSFFAGGGNESPSRTRGSRSCAHAVSLREPRAHPLTHARSSLRHAFARSQHARSRETASRQC